MRKDYATKKKEWLEKNGFNEDGITYIIKGESYSIKDALKEAGFTFNPTLLWHKAIIDEDYADRVVEVHAEDIVDFNLQGIGYYKEGTLNKIKDLTAEAPVNPSLDWAAAPGETIKDVIVELTKKSTFDGRYGLTNVVTFVDNNNLKYTWFTTTTPSFMVGDKLKISSATVKKNDIYHDEKITVITRAKLKGLA